MDPANIMQNVAEIRAENERRHQELVTLLTEISQLLSLWLQNQK